MRSDYEALRGALGIALSDVLVPVAVLKERLGLGTLRKRRERKPTLASVAKHATKAGIEVARYEVKPTAPSLSSPARPTPNKPTTSTTGLPNMRISVNGINSVTKRLADGTRRTYWYAWKGGPPLRGKPGTPEFIASYNEAAAKKMAPPTGVLLALLFRFQESAEFQFGIPPHAPAATTSNR